MTRYILILCILIFSAACTKETQMMAISIKNNTGDTIKCTFYPKKPAKDIVYEFEISHDYPKEFGNSNNMDLSPGDLLRKSLDSISLKIATYSKTIVFKNGEAKNYKTNPYNADYLWVLEKSTTSSTNSHESHSNYLDTYIITINLQDTL